MKRPSFTRVVLPILAALGMVFAAFMVWAGQPARGRTDPAETPPTAPVAQAKTGTVSGAGVVEPSSELIEVGAQRPGLVTRVAVRAGDRVSRGQLLFTIDSRDADSDIAEARAAVALARSRVRSAAVDLDAAQRQLNLYTAVEDPRAVAEQQVIDRRSQRDQASARLAVARADVDTAEARLASAQTEAGLLAVRAPRSAQVLQVRTRAGQYATAGPGAGGSEPLMILGETQPLHVRIDVDESEIGRAAFGAPAMVSPQGSASARVRATFVRAEPLVVPKRSLTNAATERVDVRVLQLLYALPADANGFFVGQQVDAYIPAKGGPGNVGRAGSAAR
ncbi:MAG TPA: biotin/lipoyl-binding protein [Sphingomonadaceae bacterium]|nr:biotin/lipoyl-binding protein [Sphingomonadaceae bacterium]